MTDQQEASEIPFKPVEPYVYFKKFLEEHDHPTWDEYLQFLLTTFPQRDQEGNLLYVIEGGIAVKLFHPERTNPGDIDIIDFTGNLSQRIGPNTRWFNAVTLDQWLLDHNLPVSNDAKAILKREVMDVTFMGITMTILNADMLATTKKLSYKDRQRRDKDQSDFELLGVDEKFVQMLMNQLKGI